MVSLSLFMTEMVQISTVLWHDNASSSSAVVGKLHNFIELETHGILKSFLIELVQISAVLWHDYTRGGSAVVGPRLLILRSRV